PDCGARRAGERLVLRLLRRVGTGDTPEVELGRYLTEATSFAQVPPLAGHLQYVASGRAPAALAALQVYVPNHGSGWQQATAAAGEALERAAVGARQRRADAGWAEHLGRRTAELHLALADAIEDPRLAPEPCTALQRRSQYQSSRGLAPQVL